MNGGWFRRLAWLGTVLAFCVIVLGAFVRLNNAGLGCPDWPTCYGQVTPPDEAQEIAEARRAFPGAVIQHQKAWYEMIHRYLAGSLGLLILVLAALAWRHRAEPGQPVALPLLLVLLVCLQGALGMWTVTLLLRPVIVTLHLLMGMSTLALLAWIALSTGRDTAMPRLPGSRGLRAWALGGLLVLFCQIMLGGWTSTNYAGYQCTDFPTCQGQWWPPTDFGSAFTLTAEPGVNYEGGRLDNTARVTIHLVHRIGAAVTFVYLLALALAALRAGDERVRRLGGFVLFALLIQIGLGIGNVLLGLPLPLAVAHNGGAALLLLSLVIFNRRLWRFADTGQRLA
jgi:cytochrome c oxidase assembly protein subunit 15